MKYYKPKAPHIVLRVNPLDLERYANFVGIPESLMTRTAVLSTLLKKRTTMSLLTAMPHTLKMYGQAPTEYMDWLCRRANRPLAKEIYRADNTAIGALEDKVGEILQNEGSRRTPRATFDALAENRDIAMREVLRDYGVDSIDGWMLREFGFRDRPVGLVKVTRRSEDEVEVKIGFDIRTKLDKYVASVGRWLDAQGVGHEMEYAGID